MSLLLALLYVAPPEPAAKGSHGIEKRPAKPKRGRYEVDSFSDFVRKPIITRNDDDELMLIFMMQGG